MGRADPASATAALHLTFLGTLNSAQRTTYTSDGSPAGRQAGPAEGNAMPIIKTVIHVHTDYSPDCDIAVEFLAARARDLGIGCIAVTDHDAIDGARRLRDLAPFKVIVGEEVSTRDGHLIALFIEKLIPPGMSARETALAIKAEGGLVLLPHMFARAFGCGLRRAALDILDLIDAVEVNNAQSLTSRADRLAVRFAQRHRLVTYAGSDAHLPCSVAPCFQEMDDFHSPAEFLRSLAAARLVRGYHPLRYMIPMCYRSARCLLGLPFPAHVGVNAVGRSTPAGRSVGAGDGVPAAAAIE